MNAVHIADPASTPAVHTPHEREPSVEYHAGWRARMTRTFGMRRLPAGVAVVATIVLAFTLYGRSSFRAAPSVQGHTVNVALMNFGDQQQPAIRALTGLVATYLIRDTSIDIADGAGSATYQVIADFRADDDELFGTVQIKAGDALVSSTALRTSTRVGMDTVAAQIARYVEDVVSPIEHHTSPRLAIGAARQHLLYARADYARGVRQNASFELEKATEQLDSVSRLARDAEWKEVNTAVARERDWQLTR